MLSKSKKLSSKGNKINIVIDHVIKSVQIFKSNVEVLQSTTSKVYFISISIFDFFLLEHDLLT